MNTARISSWAKRSSKKGGRSGRAHVRLGPGLGSSAVDAGEFVGDGGEARGVEDGADDGHLPHGLQRDREKVAEQIQKPKALGHHAHDRPPEHQHHHHAAEEARDTTDAAVPGFLPEKARASAEAHRKQQSRKEHHVPQRQQERVEEEHHAEAHEQQAEAQQRRPDLLVVGEHAPFECAA
eukprot:CAMPEP_0198648948 /NCGR_PEP_ID=MMETSP1467-20131203/3892_1 /TAXON_ID=1462469 /ORGANISM="unid. sp., Strain CCMP2135" /LENGTH=179 /DNA_ID=CAMNT_0044384697 /DNA_START=460 /DNA_END=995 /DNA_ORIENTATION=-